MIKITRTKKLVTIEHDKGKQVFIRMPSPLAHDVKYSGDFKTKSARKWYPTLEAFHICKMARRKYFKLIRKQGLFKQSIAKDKPQLTLESAVLLAVNRGLSYHKILESFEISHYQPFKAFGATEWERVKVYA